MTSAKSIYKATAIATLLAAIVFRRNLSAELALVTGQTSPNTASGWFALLHNNSLVGLTQLNVFDIVNYVLVGVMFVGVYFALRQTSPKPAALAAVLSSVGIAAYIVSNSSFSMLSLSSQYANAATDAQKSALLAAGQALIANGVPGAVYQGIGGITSLFLLSAAGLIISVVMLRSRIFSKATALAGILACTLDLAYIVGLAFMPAGEVYLLSALCLSTAGFLLLVWHLMVGINLFQLSRAPKVKGGVKP